MSRRGRRCRRRVSRRRRATGLPEGAAGLNPIRKGQAGGAPQQTTAVTEGYREPRFWLYNDNYFAWQPNSPGRTTVKFQISIRTT